MAERNPQSSTSAKGPKTKKSSPPTKVQKKLVVVGDGACGKTCLLHVWALNHFPTGYVASIFENYVKDVAVDGQEVELTVWDTAGQEDYDRLRALCYPDTDVVAICFAVDYIISLENIIYTWMPEVKHHCPNAAIVLVALKADLRDDQKVLSNIEEDEPIVTVEQGEKLAAKIKAAAYVECSAKMMRNVQGVFEAAARAALKADEESARRRRRRKCDIL